MACSKDKADDVNLSQSINTIQALESNQFTPSREVASENGMIVFSTQQDFQVISQEIALARRDMVDNWERNLGFVSQARLFNQLIAEETELQVPYENLSSEGQAAALQQPEPHCNLYYSLLDEGVIKIITDTEGSYFDYAAYNPALSMVVNRSGFVKIEGKIYQIKGNLIKIITDGDFEKIPVISGISNQYNSNNMVVSEMLPVAICGNSWSTSNPWTVINSGKRRFRVNILGNSQPVGKPLPGEDCCTDFMNCTYNFRTEAQLRNFWGNYKYQSSFSPTLTFSGFWSYNYAITTSIECGGGIDSRTNDLGTPSISAKTVPATNNGFFPLVPNGVWSAAGQKHFIVPFNVPDFSFTAMYNGIGFTLIK